MKDLCTQLLPLGAELFDRTEWARPARAEHLDERRRDRRDKDRYLVARQVMKYDLFIRVALTADLPEPGADHAR